MNSPSAGSTVTVAADAMAPVAIGGHAHRAVGVEPLVVDRQPRLVGCASTGAGPRSATSAGRPPRAPSRAPPRAPPGSARSSAASSSSSCMIDSGVRSSWLAPRDERAPAADHVLDAGEHLVERLSERADLVAGRRTRAAARSTRTGDVRAARLRIRSTGVERARGDQVARRAHAISSAIGPPTNSSSAATASAWLRSASDTPTTSTFESASDCAVP